MNGKNKYLWIGLVLLLVNILLAWEGRHVLEAYGAYAFAAIVILLDASFFLHIPKISNYITAKRANLENLNTLISLLAVVGLVFTVLSFKGQQDQFAAEQKQQLSQQQAQQEVQAENENAYLQSSETDLSNASSAATSILEGMPNYRANNGFPYFRFFHANLDKIVNDPNLSQQARRDIITEAANMDTANNVMAELATPYVDRSSSLATLQQDAEGILAGIQRIDNELPPNK